MIYATFYFKVLRIIKSQNMSSPAGALCRVFSNFFLRLIKMMKSLWIITLHLFMFLRANNYPVISLELLIVTDINLNGNSVGSFPMVSKISSNKYSENSP